MEMDFTQVLELINGVGFPIALVAVLLWFIFKLQTESVERENKLYGVISEYGAKLGEISSILTQVCDTLSNLSERVIEIEGKLEKKE